MLSSARPTAPRLLSRLLAAAVLLPLVACQTVPITGRSAFNTFTVEQDIEIGREAYAQVLSDSPVVDRGRALGRVRRVMERLVAVADDPGFEWEVSLIDDDATVNAFALPGGKMAVYTGLLPVAEDEAGLAVVMGHEIGHVVARHSTERLARTLPAAVLLDFLDLGEVAPLAAAAIELCLHRPHGRAQESEADAIGLIYMARAGYDPRRALEFWKRMGAATGDAGGSGGLEAFFSTHPAPETRIADLEARMDEALAEWRAHGSGNDAGF